jgi:hypothetical protein
MVPAAEEQHQPAELADADAENAAPAPAPTTTETEQQQQQETDADFSKMTVAQLKVELEKRNLPQDGLKAALIQRLEEAA